MSTYSLLQLTLDQTISREDLESAATVLETLARPDIAKLPRELFGIVASGLQWEEANAFRVELARYSYQTEVVADDDIPFLTPSYAVQRIAWNPPAYEFTNAMGRTQVRRLPEAVFLAGGYLSDTELKIETSASIEAKPSQHGSYPSYTITRQRKMISVPQFRLDFFFSTAPHRIHVLITPENVAFFQDQPLRLRHPRNIMDAREELRTFFPPERLTNGMLQEDTHPFYPNMTSYEEEIRWRFYQLNKNRS